MQVSFMAIFFVFLGVDLIFIVASISSLGMLTQALRSEQPLYYKTVGSPDALSGTKFEWLLKEDHTSYYFAYKLTKGIIPALFPEGRKYHLLAQVRRKVTVALYFSLPLIVGIGLMAMATERY